MKYLVGNRGSGVTTDLLMEASRFDGIIIAPYRIDYEKKARELGIKCPRIITFKEFLDKENPVRGLDLEKEKVYIDGLGRFLKTLGLGNVVTAGDTSEWISKQDQFKLIERVED